ncbi:cyclopropane-fatty-acyl-phospholipid synthase family protein [Amycolatopsis sp. H20-H5]|uniref:cyclopropane-fatty-acyl-phospholipid synthase family protein n=1 Tax=Amycolatopsis sp. H20-H5 TaxID=3046309 RepID=UPI002DB9B6BA|nr:cyclopropane-fatty-acyl-phospholipid synthase family protein [Amycolatopsis sp. H20-H5]MEC3977283.1 cyclopropane-fatty-acyl-phospholipid synthase family protein [Amycolatopsis sp. H20-H5]
MSRTEPSVGKIFDRVLGSGGEVSITAYDGSSSGPADAGVKIEIRSPLALSYLVSSPGDLGLARSYVAGALEVHGDLYTALRALVSQVDQLSAADRLWLLRELGPRHLRRVPLPPEELPGRFRRNVDGLRHSRTRDSNAISRHYDVSNRFYELVLGSSMAYTCAVFPEADATLEQAQENKFDLVCRKLGLKPGMRLLDVGCGWGGMVAHAAQHYGVQVIGVTLSREQALWAQKDIVAKGLADRAEVRHSDYRDVTEWGFDAVSSIGLTEHIGARQVPAYFRFLSSKLKPRGRLLNHCITNPNTRVAHRSRGFIDRYVFPDGELEAVGEITSAMQDNGFEVRHVENLREHYAKTLAGWCVNLDENWTEAVGEAGEGRGRVWALYMAACRLAFERHELELSQVLGVKVGDGGDAGMPLRPDWGV